MFLVILGYYEVLNTKIKGSNIGKPNAGFCSNISVCLHQTPREQKTEEQI